VVLFLCDAYEFLMFYEFNAFKELLNLKWVFVVFGIKVRWNGIYVYLDVTKKKYRMRLN